MAPSDAGRSAGSFDLRWELRRLEDRVAQARLRPEYELLVKHALQVAAREASRPTCDTHRVAEALARAARLLRGAGAFIGSGPMLAESLRRIAQALGPHGRTVTAAL